MYEISGRQFFRTTTVIQQWPDFCEEYRWLWPFQTIWKLEESYAVSNYFYMVKQVNRFLSQQDQKPYKKISANYFVLSYSKTKIIKSTKYSWIYFVKSAISNSPKFARVVCLACFKNPFVTNISLFKLHFRHRRFILFVQMREVICFSTRSWD